MADVLFSAIFLQGRKIIHTFAAGTIILTKNKGMQNIWADITSINRNNLPLAKLLTLGHRCEHNGSHLTAALAMSNIFVLPTYQNPLREKNIRTCPAHVPPTPSLTLPEREGNVPAERARGFCVQTKTITEKK